MIMNIDFKKKEPTMAQTRNGSKRMRQINSVNNGSLSKVGRFVKKNCLLPATLVTILLVGIALGASMNGSSPLKSAACSSESFYALARHGYEDGVPVNWQHVTDAWAKEAGAKKRYKLKDSERVLIARVIEAEAGAEPYAGKIAVAQCILQACEDDGIRPAEVVHKYSYSPARPQVSQESLDAVQAVFDFGHVATSEPIKFFYAPSMAESEWHEEQNYVMTISGHRFFKEAH